jgi:hypothetical protein
MMTFISLFGSTTNSDPNGSFTNNNLMMYAYIIWTVAEAESW